MTLIKYGKSVVNEQFILNRLANSSIDIYATAVVLSRASIALKEETSTALHERQMAEAFSLDAFDRIDANLKAISSGKSLDHFTKLSSIAKNVCASSGVPQSNPLKF